MGRYKFRKFISVTLIALGIMTCFVWLFIYLANTNIDFLNKYLFFIGLGILFIGILVFPLDILRQFVKERYDTKSNTRRKVRRKYSPQSEEDEEDEDDFYETMEHIDNDN